MKAFFQDEYINLKVLSHLRKEILENQLDKTIEEIGYLNELQKNEISDNKNAKDNFRTKLFKKN